MRSRSAFASQPAGGGYVPVVPIPAAIADADIVLLAIPYYVLDDVLPHLAGPLSGKTVIDATNPVSSEWAVIPTGDGSGAEHVQSFLPASRVAKAFNTIFADVVRPDRMDRQGQKIALLVASDDGATTAKVMRFGAGIGFDPVDAGLLKSACYLEGIAHLNIELAVGRGGGTNATVPYDRAA